MPARLIVIGSDPPVVHPLAAFTTIGRDNTSVVFLDDEFVAGDHARIVLTRASQWEIHGVNECLVVVDGARITDSRVLRSGDTFVIGGTHLRFEADEIESSAGRHFANVVAAPDPGPPTVWVVPRGKECVVRRRRAGDVFRGGPPQLEELGGVAMPAGAPHVVDVAADMLVFARRGRLTIVRGLVRGPRDERSVEVPGRTKIHALALIDGVAGLLVAAAVLGCGSALEHRAVAHCEGLVVALRNDALPRVQSLATTPGLRFEAVQFAFDRLHPHGGARPCRLATLAPAGWSAAATAEANSLGAVWTSEDGRSRWRIDAVGGSHAADEWPGLLEQEELLGRRTGTILRDEAGARSHVLVTREDDEVLLLMLRWHPPQPSYVRCEARLAGPYAIALPAFEAACAATSSLWWTWSK